ncbi:WD repeat-containing protein wrap73 [Linderina pennispora]|nr:WD repeat-containing protein wrap73 [Linderina pennispora]
MAVEHRLIVRDSESPKRIQRVYACEYSAIQDVAWSSDSQYILTASYAQNRVDVWSLEDEQWRCSIIDEAAQVTRAQWSPDARHILTLSELELRLSIWALDGSARRYIQHPKSGRASLAFHPEGTYMALVQRHDYRDYIGIYGVGTWEMAREIPLEDMVDCVGVTWSPDGLHLCAWDMPATFSVVVLNAIGIMKRALADSGLGVGRAVWAPAGELLAVCGLDRKIRMLNDLTWRSIATLEHRRIPPSSADVFLEVDVDVPLAQQAKALGSPAARRRTRFDLVQGKVQKYVPADIHRVGSRQGVSAAFSADGVFLATRDETMPNCVWVWRTDRMRCVAVVQMQLAVREFRWSPVESVLAVVTGSSSVYLWKDAKGCMVCEVPAANALALGIRWNPNGDSLAVLSRGLFCLAQLPA